MTLPTDRAAKRPPERDLPLSSDVIQARFEACYGQYYDRIFNYIMRSVMHRPLAEDIVSQAFLKALDGFPRFKGCPEQLLGWLYRIATNVLMDHYRQARKENTGVSSETADTLFFTQGLVALDDPGKALEQAEQYQALHGVIQQLKGIYRVVIVLHYFEEKSIQEISDILGCTRGTVKWRLHHARKQLAARLAKENLNHEN